MVRSHSGDLCQPVPEDAADDLRLHWGNGEFLDKNVVWGGNGEEKENIVEAVKWKL